MGRPLQRFKFCLYYWPRWFLSIPFIAVPIFAYARSALGEYRGIKVCSFSVSKIPSSEFLARTLEALQLIERVDARRFRRIQQEIQFIVHGELLVGAEYDRLGRVCTVDFTYYDFEKNYKWYLWSYAGALVHEATHGAVYGDPLRTQVRAD